MAIFSQSATEKEDKQSSPNSIFRGGGLLRTPWFIALTLGLATMALYWPAIHCDFTNYDDPDYVTSNPHVLAGLSANNVVWAFTTGAAGNWHPLTWLSLMLDVTLFGPKAGGMHFTAVLLHAANVVLLFWLLRSLTGATWRSASVAALFGWHPTHVESVAWVTERKDVLSAFFGFLALIFYTLYARQSEIADLKAKARRHFYSFPAYWLAWLFFALGLMSKPMLVTWPCVLLLVDFWPLDRWKSVRLWLLIREKAPFFALVVLASLVTFFVQKQGGAVVLIKNLSWSDRGANAVISYGRYLEKIFWPTNLAVFYPRPPHWPVAALLLSALILGGISAIVWRQRKRYPFLLTGWLWYGGTLVPVIGLIQVGAQAMADRYLYIPSVGVFIILVWGAWQMVGGHHRAVMPLCGAAFLAFALCAVLTRRQIGFWQNSETLFQHAVAVTRGNFIAYYNLGLAEDGLGKTDEAIHHYQDALQITPNYADIHCCLGFALMQEHHPAAAIRQYQEALRLHPDDAWTHDYLGVALNSQGLTNAALGQFAEAARLKPDFAPAHFHLGVVLNALGQTDAAIDQFQAAIQFGTNQAEAHYNLGNALAKKGLLDAAMAQFAETIRLAPDNAEAHNNLGSVLDRRGQSAAALSEFAAAALLQPADADKHYNFAQALLRAGRSDEAISEFKEAIQLKPDYAPAHYNLGVALGKTGHTDDAISQLKEATRLQPDYAIAYNSLGVLLAAQGRIGDAITQFRMAVRIKPDYASAQGNLAKALAAEGK